MAGNGPVRVIDETAKDAILRYPTVDLIRKLFPDVKQFGRTVLCNPLRGDRNASLSCFRSRSGYPRWKDHGTGETGDNIDFFRMAFPHLDYVEAVDQLSYVVLGRSALTEAWPQAVRPSRQQAGQAARRHVVPEESRSALEVVSVSPLYPNTALAELVGYWRGRGISDEVVSRYCSQVVFENANIRGRAVVDPVSGIPETDADGNVVRRDGRSWAVAMRNDIGGWSFRVPETAAHAGFKGCDHAFVSTFYADGGAVVSPVSPVDIVRPFGHGGGMVERLRYDPSSRVLWYNGVQGFTGIRPEVVHVASPFLSGWRGRYLDGRDLMGAVAVLNALNRPLSPAVAVVEGLFDGLSLVEFNRMEGRGPVPGVDLLVLNSVSNINWAVPFLAAHSEVRSYLDNDLKSSAGQKAFEKLEEDVAAYSAKICGSVRVVNASAFFRPYKDVNDYLMKLRGFDVKAPVAEIQGDRKKEAPRPSPSRKSVVGGRKEGKNGLIIG